ncbi:RDD family protein [Clostridium sp. Marseille-QA1073]
MSNNNEHIISFKEIFKTTIIDLLVMLGISAFSTVILDFILRIFGYFIAEKIQTILVLYLITYIIYNVVMTLKKDGMTFGQKASKLKLVKSEEENNNLQSIVDNEE